MGDLVIVLILIIVVGGAVFGTVRRIRHGSSCCGARDAAPKKVRVADRNKNNYPYVYELSVDGMHCGNCTLMREYTLASGGPYCDCGYKKKVI